VSFSVSNVSIRILWGAACIIFGVRGKLKCNYWSFASVTTTWASMQTQMQSNEMMMTMMILLLIYGRNWIVACTCLKWSTASSMSLASWQYSTWSPLLGVLTWSFESVASINSFQFLYINLQRMDSPCNRTNEIICCIYHRHPGYCWRGWGYQIK